MSTSNPPPSSIQRAVELDRVRDVMLLDGEEQLRVDPIARQQGEKAPRARLEGQLRQCRLEGDRDTERVLSLEAARIHFENAFDVDMAVQLLHRALEIRDDEELRMQLARQLAAMGRHIEAGHVLRDGEPSDAVAVFTAWLESGEAYARGGDAEEAVATFRETAMVAPDDPIPFARIASVAYWTSGMVPRERAADAWLEGAKRQEPGSKEHFACIIRAFEVAPAYARSAEAYTSLLNRTGRSAEADELWRVYALASGHVGPVAKRRTEVALQSGDFLRALGATLEANLAPRTHSSVLPSLTELLARAPVREWIGAHTDDADAFCQRLTETVLEKRGRDRAESLRELAIRLAGEPKALLLVYAAECFAAAGESGRATGTARHACSLAPWLPRAQAALFEIAGAETPVEELERALAHLPARGALHRVLAERYLGEGRSDLALAFSRRVVDLRPGDLQPLLAHLHCAMAAEEPQVLADAIAVALESPRPWRELGPGVAVALDALLELDRPTALAMASQVLSTIGPGEGDLYRSIRAVASRCGDGVLELAATLGHAIGDEVDDEARAPVYLEAVDLSLAYGDVEGAAVHVSRAAAHSGPVEDLLAAITKVRAAIAALDPGARSDARISLARAVAWTAEQQDQDSAVEAWRHLGALRWDLADDRTGSEEAFFVACAIEPESGPYRYSVDLVDRAGPRDAVRMIVDRAASARDDGASLRLVAKLYAAASRIAADEGMVESALEAAVNAVRCDPARADAVAVVEKFAHGDQGLAALNEVYNLLAEAALGRYGYRAAHYRAARQLETRGAFQDALRHAVAAFEAVPSVGASYKMLLRLATRAGNEAAAVHALTAVASEFPIEGQIAWLLRAVEVAARSGTGAELLTELMLKALSLGPSAEVADRLPLLGRAIADDVVDERVELLQQRLTRAVTEALPRLEGPAGADVAIRLAVGVSGWLPAELPVAALLRAVAIDPHDADYTAVLDHVEDLVEDPARARELLEAVNERRSDRRPLSASLKELVSRLYLSLSEVPPASRPNAFTEAAPLAGDEPPDSGDLVTERPPDDLPLAPVKSEADDEVLFAERFDALEDHEGRPSDPEGRVKVTLQSQRPPSTKSRPTEAEENDPLASLPAEDEDDLGHEGEPSDWPSDGDPFDYSPASEAAARRRGDHAAIARMLAARAAETDNLEQRRLIRLRRAAVLEQRLGRLDDACEELERIIKEVGEDPTALRYLADLSERRKHYARGAKLWLRASQQATDVDEKIRDVVRCGEALVAAGKLETAQKLLEAARGLPQSTKLLRLRVAVARRLEDDRELARAEAELAALGPDGDDAPSQQLEPVASALPDEGAAHAVEQALDRSGTISEPPDRLAGPFVPGNTPAPRDTPMPRIGGSPAVSRRVFRVNSEDDGDDDRSASEVLADCHREYLEQGLAGAREAKRMIRRLRSIDEALEESDRDLHTFLLVEALDAAQGVGAANLALQHHWESIGSTPLVTLAVAERLVGRGDLRPALQLYRRVIDRDLKGIRQAGRVALDAAAVAWKLGDEAEVVRHLDRAAADPDCAELAEQRRKQWQAGGGVATVDAPALTHEPFDIRWDATQALRPRSLVKTDAPRASEPLEPFEPPPPFDDEDDAPDEPADEALPTDDVEADGHADGEALHEVSDAAMVDHGDAGAADEGTEDEGTEGEGTEDEGTEDEGVIEASITEVDDLPPDETPPAPVADAPAPPEEREVGEVGEDDGGDAGKPAGPREDDVESLDPADLDVTVTTSAPSDSLPPARRPSGAPPSSFPPRPSSPPSSRDRHSLPPGHQTVEHITSIPPAPSEPPSLVSVVRRIPSFPDLRDPSEELLFDALLAGEVGAGDELATRLDAERSHDLLCIRRHQATLQRGDVPALRRLRDAAAADQAGSFARAVDHVIAVFDPSEPARPPSPLQELPAQPESTKRLLFSWLRGTINEALAIVCETGMVRRELADYDLTGADRVQPVATTPVGRVYAALTRVLDLGVRLFHRNRASGPLVSSVALVSPLGAILEGIGHDDANLPYLIASALAAATPEVALVEALDEGDVRNIVLALLAGFGPVEESSVSGASRVQMRIAEDLWHMVPAAADHRLRSICRDSPTISYEIAVANAESTRRRAGLFGCGDLRIAVQQTVRELDLPAPARLDPDALRELCQHPAIADLYDLAILPEYAEARWTG